jgi:hypothetical protein
MSLRTASSAARASPPPAPPAPPAPPIAFGSACGVGSLFGPAIGAPGGQLWDSMAVSPPRSPPLRAVEGEGPDDALSLGASELGAPGLLLSAGEPAGASAEPIVDAVCATYEAETAGAALVRFAQERGVSAVMTGKHGKRVRNVDFVVAKPVASDAVLWRPMQQTAAGRGHIFFLMHEGRVACRIEVSESGGALGRVAVVDPAHTALAVSAGVADPSSLLEYVDPEAHLRALRALRARMREDAEVGYIPTSELVVGRGLEALPLALKRGEPGAAAAPAVWARTKRFLTEMSTLAADAVEAHADAEFARVGAGEHFRELTGGWREHVV